MSVKSNTNAASNSNASTDNNEKKEFNMKGSIESIIASLKKKVSEIFAYAKAQFEKTGYSTSLRPIMRAIFIMLVAILLLKIWATIFILFPVIGMFIVYWVAFGCAERMVVRAQEYLAQSKVAAA